MKNNSAILRLKPKTINGYAKARMRARYPNASSHSDVRIIVQGGVDVSDLNITISSKEVLDTRKARGIPRPKRKKKIKTNPSSVKF